MKLDTKKYEDLLLLEKTALEERLSRLGRRNPATPGGFEATYAESDELEGEQPMQKPDPSDRADSIEEYETRNAIEVQLEARYHEVLAGLARIENHTYGWCAVKGESHPIEEARLEINPAANTCVAHKDIEQQ